jgi:hypothetical protein
MRAKGLIIEHQSSHGGQPPTLAASMADPFNETPRYQPGNCVIFGRCW